MKLLKIYLLSLLFLALGISLGYAQDVNINGSCIIGVQSIVYEGDASVQSYNEKPVYYNGTLGVTYQSEGITTNAYVAYLLAAELGTPENRWVVLYGGQPYYYLISEANSAPSGEYLPFDTEAAVTDCGGSVFITIPCDLFAMSNSGSFCTTTQGTSMGLSGSQLGISYQLYLDGSTIGSAVAGTGNAISFGVHSAVGTYTVKGVACDTMMTGSTIINPLPPAPFLMATGVTTFCEGGTVGIQASVGMGSMLNFNASPKRVQISSLNISTAVYPTLTMSAWTKRSGNLNSWGAVFSNDDGGYDRALMVNNTDKMYHIFAGRDINTGIPSELNQWDFMTVTWSASAVTLYKNGVQVFTTSAEDSSSSSTGTAIGQASSGNWAWNGSIDNVSIWNSSRTAPELVAEMNTLLAGDEAGLVAYYKLDENTGTSTADATVNAHNGTLINNPAWATSTAPSSIPGLTYLWTDGATTLNLPNVTVGGNYSLQVTNGTGCIATSSSMSVTVNPSLTPTVTLSSSDGDNNFAYGTLVTFTATPSDLGGGTVSYDFKVNGATVQNGASNTYAVSNLTDGEQVLVAITVTNGVCLTTNTASSGTITNTVTGAVLVDFIYNCGGVSNSINPTFYCSTPDVGASTLSYRFKITNTVTSAEVIVDRIVPNAHLLLTSIAAYTTLYTAQVAVVVDGIEQPFSDVCSVTTAALPLNKVVSTQCGGTLAALNSTINVLTTPGALNYRFKVTLTSNPGVSEEFVSPFPSLRLTSLATIPLNYGNTYAIQVQSDIVNNGAASTSAYGDVCNVSTLPVSSISTTTNQCGATLAAINSRIFVNTVPGATQYTYRVALESAPGTVYTVSTPFTNFRLTAVPGLPLLFNTTYNVAVNVLVNGIESGYGTTECQYTTPAGPTTQIQTSQCGEMVAYEVPSNSTLVYADFVSGASYRYKLERFEIGNPIPVYSQTISYPINFFRLNMFTGLEPDTEYSVSVALDFYGVGEFGKDCTIKTPAAAPPREMELPFSALAYPNPFATSFTIAVTTKSSSAVSIKVYDMIGRLVEERTSKVTDLETTTVGDRYPSGVYNVIVTQDSTVSTVRMIKR